MKQIFLLSSVFLSFVMSLFGGIVEEGLKNISWREKIYMKNFFNFAIKIDQAAHVLCFENKPVCFTTVVVERPHRSFRETLCLKGWIAFKKNEHLFPHPGFIFCEELYTDEDFKILDIYIINKRALYKCLCEYAPLFTEVIGEEFSPDWFIGKLAIGRQLSSLINRNDMLLGLILGYGVESSIAYHEAQVDAEIPEWTDSYCGVEARKPKRCKIFPVGFMGNPNSDEVKNLLSTYDIELEEIWAMYRKHKNPLKMALEQLCVD